MAEYNSSPSAQAPAERKTRIPRATQRILGLVAHQQGEHTPVEQVRVEPEAWSFLMTMLERVGTYRSGPLFGDQIGAAASVTDAAHRGYHQLDTGLYRMDPSYVLGWSDCLSQYGSDDVDWIGHWAMLPDNRATSELNAFAWVQAAALLGLVSERHFLVFIGLVGEQVRAHAYLWVQGEAVELYFQVT